MSNSTRKYTQSYTQGGIGLGSAIAVAISWSLYKSIWWAFLHGLFGWFYVIYYAMNR